MKNIVIVADDSEMEAAIYALSLAAEEFHIVKIFGLGEVDYIQNTAVDRFTNITMLENMEFDYVLNINALSDKVKSILIKMIPAQRILDYEEFQTLYLDECQRMEYLKHRLALLYNNDTLENECISIGDFTYGRPDVLIAGNSTAKLKIGKFCSISKSVEIALCVEHRKDWNSTWPFNVWMPEFSYIEGHPASKGDVNIGNDVWIGGGVTILSGVTIGDGCIIGAKAVVANSVPEYCIVAGNPGRMIKKRFSDEIIEKLKLMQWWDWEYQDIYHAIPLLQSNDIAGLYDYFLKYIINKM